MHDLDIFKKYNFTKEEIETYLSIRKNYGYIAQDFILQSILKKRKTGGKR